MRGLHHALRGPPRVLHLVAQRQLDREVLRSHLQPGPVLQPDRNLLHDLRRDHRVPAFHLQLSQSLAKHEQQELTR